MYLMLINSLSAGCTFPQNGKDGGKDQEENRAVSSLKQIISEEKKDWTQVFNEIKGLCSKGK